MKECKDVMFQYSWLNALPLYRPHNLTMNLERYLCYDFVDGQHPTNWQWVHNKMMDLWHWNDGKGTLECNRAEYVDHVASVADHFFSSNDFLRIVQITEYVERCPLTPVTFCHGDLTLYNVLQAADDEMILIDPCPTRGLPCRELDESKMLQSLDGFGQIYRNLPPVDVLPPFPTKRIHLVLLLTHYVRMLPHVGWHAPAFSFAKTRVNQLMELLS